jgi:hypothetical protein
VSSGRSALILRAAFPADTALPPGSQLVPVDEALGENEAGFALIALQDHD